MIIEDQTRIIQNTYSFLNNEDIATFLSITDCITYKHKTQLITKGENSNQMYFILKGMIRGFFVNDKGKEKNIFIRPEHTVMGAPESIFSNKRTKYTIEVISDSTLLEYSYSNFIKLIEEKPIFTKMMFHTYQEVIHTLITRVESLIDKNPEQRYAELIEKHPQFFQKVYHKHIANYLGITSVSLSRIIKRRMNTKK